MEAWPYVPGDALPGAPALAVRGPQPVGVTTLTLTNAKQIDVLGSLAAGEPTRGRRSLVAEAWYPAVQDGRTTYVAHTAPAVGAGDGRPGPTRFWGRAARDTEPDRSVAPSPLVVVSRGHPGSRVMLSWLGENLASEGFAVLALDPTDSTHADQADPLSSLRNRPLDLAFALQAAAELDRQRPWLHGVWDVDRAALVGHALGGYGALSALGAGLAPLMFAHPSLTNPLAHELLAGLELDDPFQAELVDAVTARVRAAVLLAPWGGSDVRTDGALARVRTPLFIAAGSEDDVGGYAGVRRAIAASRRTGTWRARRRQRRANLGRATHLGPPSACAWSDAKERPRATSYRSMTSDGVTSRPRPGRASRMHGRPSVPARYRSRRDWVAVGSRSAVTGRGVAAHRPARNRV